MSNWINFFAYDQLMNEDCFKEQGLEYKAILTATLSAWRIIFNKVPVDDEGPEGLGLFNIEPTPNNAGMMEGVLYEMDERFLEKLDELHGYPQEYMRKYLRVIRHDFTFTNAIVYIAKPDRTAKGLKPSKKMMKTMRAAKKTMSMLYFSRLMNTRPCD